MIPAVTLYALLEVIAASLIAGVGVTAIFSVAILGAVRSQDSRRERRRAIYLAWAALAIVALCGVAAAVISGLRVLAS